MVSAYLLSLAAVIRYDRMGRRGALDPSGCTWCRSSCLRWARRLCGLATSTGELIVFRVIQGVGGGIIVPVGQMIMVRRRQARAIWLGS